MVVGVDLRGIQSFVFSGRRILDAVGRAALVAELTDTSDARNGVADLLPPDHVVLRDAGGALTVVLPDLPSAREFTGRYTRRLRDLAGQLTPVVALVPYGRTAGAADPEPVPAGVDEALAVLPARLREARRRMSALHTPAHGYGITAVCAVSGGPAEVVDSSRAEDGEAGIHERVTADVARARGVGRRWHRDSGAAWLDGAATATGCPELVLPMEVDRLGRDHGDVSRLAVVHVDVNGLGVILGDYRERVADPEIPGSGAVAQRRLSTRIAWLTEGLARVLVRAVAATVRAEPGRRPHIPGTGAAGPVSLFQGPFDRVRVPVRPIVVAGDDLTVLCDARLALSLARYALDWLDADPARIADPRDPRVALHRVLADAHDGAPDHGPGGGRTVTGPDGGVHTTYVPTVGVGIAVQPVGAPLSSGYDLCEAMCRRAKRYRVDRAEADPTVVDDHAIAWTLRFDGVDRVLRGLDQAALAPHPRTELPLTGSGFARFVDRYLSGAPGSLLSDGDTRHRGWLLSALVPLLESGSDPAPELDRRARVTGAAVDLPPGWTPGGLLDAVGVMDLYLDPRLAEALPTHLPQPSNRPGAAPSVKGPPR
ncbi:hypothetical protein KIK06_12050 [Nocardiopsis sp. EMB25]|uniref:hypothetical protein n=1 Tax=Nocardiopsis sp. EMB25 TaxID=2835867 RepID=UPI0022838550|nr:hypothetical protein [Nocardiopsis sp. EMB25]MCY9784624.1 hypothetical protein [Nocardiopsis sp. EMB25]